MVNDRERRRDAAVVDHRGAPRIAIFAEGTDQENTDRERTRASFTGLWEHLAARCGVQTPIIKGFSKKALTKMFVPVLAEDLKALHVGPDPERDVVPVTLPPTGQAPVGHLRPAAASRRLPDPAP